MSRTGGAAWQRASLAAAAFALDPLGGGVAVRSAPGPARDAWLAELAAMLDPAAPMRRIPASIADDRLIGGLDIAATLKAGRPIAETGVIAQADGGVLVLAMAERVPAGTAARLAAALDTGVVALERDGFAMSLKARFGFVALDEGYGEEEKPPPALIERCSYLIDLSIVGVRDIEPGVFDDADIEAARALLPSVFAGASVIEALVAAAAELGVASLRAPLFALRAARVIAALHGRAEVEDRDVALAASLTLSPRATRVPAAADSGAEEEPPVEPEAEEDRDPDDSESDRAPERLEDVVLAAAKAAIPDALLAQIASGHAARTRSAADGKSGAHQISARRGRPIGARAGSPRRERLSLISTLRAAAPWQPIRRREKAHLERRSVLVRPEDFRTVRYRHKRGTTTIFVVDASGSSAMQRFAEVKGAIELLLADCYVRRDSVALVAFRGLHAEIVLPPTRSTARAKRRLTGLPGGGGTPLASGLDAGGALADQVRRKGQSALVVLMTDGRANVSRDGTGGRARAMEDALDAGRRLFAAGVQALAIDTSPPSRRDETPATRLIAEAMHARYVKLPVADPALLNAAVRASSPRSRP
jgi:magnesium chelatase subunit D